nr:hypothetical protein [Tanacetum cinerariifolium]
MADQRTMAELLRAPTEGDSQTYSCSQSANKCCNYRYDGYSQTISSNPPPASVKAVEEICVTCGGSGSLHSNTVANPKGELKAITTRSGLVLDGPTIPTPHPFINLEEAERVEETLTDPDISEYTIKVPPPPPSGNPTFSSHPELTSLEVKDNILDPEGGNVLLEKLLDLDSNKDLHPPLHFDIESNLKEIEFLLHQDIDSSLKDSIDQSNLANLADNVVDSIPDMFTDKHALDYSSSPIFDEYDDDLFEVVSDTKNAYDDPFDSEGEKIKEVDALPLTNNEDKVFNPGILIQKNLIEIITRIVQDKKLVTSNASLVLEDFDHPLYELPFFKEVPSIPRIRRLMPKDFVLQFSFPQLH